MTANIHLINQPKLCKLDEGIILIFLSAKSAITFGEGCILRTIGVQSVGFCCNVNSPVEIMLHDQIFSIATDIFII